MNSSHSPHWFYRFAQFLLGLALMSFGIVLATKANLGTTPISSIPLILSLGLAWSMGVFTVLFNLLLVFLQIVLLRKNFPLLQFLQIPVTFLFGFLIDVSMLALSGIQPTSYLFQLAILLLGSLVLAVGVYIEVEAGFILLPGEGIVKAIADTLRFEFGKTKVGFDCSLVAFSVLASLCFFWNVQGIREGTLLSAVLVGNLVYLFRKIRQPERAVVNEA